MLNVNRNINLATPLVRAGGKGPEVLPYLNNLRMFLYYTDIPSQVDLTGRYRLNTGEFFPSYSWEPYYEDSSISASVSGALWNTLTAVSQISQSFMSRSVGEGVYFTGSLADPPTYSTNQSATSSYQVFISGSSTLSDISSSWTFVTYVKPDPIAQGNFNYGLAQQNLYNYTWPVTPGFVKSAGIDFSKSSTLYGVITVSTGNPFLGIPNRMHSGSFLIPGGIDVQDGNYHMITITVNNLTASVYVDNQLTSGSGFTAGDIYSWNFANAGPQTNWVNMKYGSNVSAQILGGPTTTYRAFNGWNKGIAIWNKGFDISDVNTVYNMFVIDNFAPGRNA